MHGQIAPFSHRATKQTSGPIAVNGQNPSGFDPPEIRHPHGWLARTGGAGNRPRSVKHHDLEATRDDAVIATLGAPLRCITPLGRRFERAVLIGKAAEKLPWGILIVSDEPGKSPSRPNCFESAERGPTPPGSSDV